MNRQAGRWSGLAVLVLLGSSCGPALPDGKTEGAAVEVRVHRVEWKVEPVPVEVPGVVRAVDVAVLASRIAGTVDRVEAVPGQEVRGGSILVVVRAEEWTARLRQAEALLQQARADLARERDLLQRSATTADSVRTQEDRVRLAQAQVEEAETLLGYTLLRAPFDGVVTRKHVGEGDLAMPGVPLLEVERPSRFEVVAGVPEALGQKLQVGQRAGVDIPTAGIRRLEVRLTEVSPAADPVTRTIPVKAQLPEGMSLRSGQFSRLRLEGEERPVLRVPSNAVSTIGQLERVFVLDGDRVRLRLIRTGAEVDGRVEVLAGLRVGEQVVLDPGPGLRDGARAEVRRLGE